MQTLQAGLSLERFFATVGSNRPRLLMLDYDGTLAPFRIKRDQATPYPGVRIILNAMLVAGHTRLALISERQVGDVLKLLKLAQPIEIWGSYGAERFHPDGRYHFAGIGSQTSEGIARARTWARGHNLLSYCEQKPTGLALHWRELSAEQIAPLQAEIKIAWSLLAEEYGLKLEAFDGGMELRAAQYDKGRVVQTLLEEMGPEVVAAYLGDDLTDENAFQSLGQHGDGVGILVRAEQRPTAAMFWARPPSEQLFFLSRWHQICGGKWSDRYNDERVIEAS